MALALTLLLISYLMGSICSAIIVCKLFNLPDPREEGSKNPGATNVLRISGKKYAALVLLVDLLKGTIPVLIAKALGVSSLIVSLTALFAVLGHIYPLFFNFKGGKGVATAIGALLGLQFIVGIMVVATWLLILHFMRYSSLASIISIMLSPLYAILVTHDINIFPPLCFIALLILFKHRNNITRLTDGTEPKVFIKDNVIKEVMEEAHPQPANDPVVDLDINPKKPSSIKKKIVPKITEKEEAPKKTHHSEEKAKKKPKVTSEVKPKKKTKPPSSEKK